MTTPDIRVILQPDGVKDVIAGLRSIRRESQALRRDTAAIADPFSRRGGFVGLFDKAEPAANRLGGALGGILGTAQRLVPVLGFAGAATGLISLGRNALQTASQVGDLNEQFGTTSEELTTLQFLARTNGANNEILERGLAGLAKSQRELAAGTEDVVAAYADLGLTAKDFQGLNLAQSFELVAKSIDGIDPTKLDLDSVLGRNARRLIPSLNKLASEGLAGVRIEGERVGAVLDSKTTSAVKRLGDQLQRSKELVSGLANDLLSFFAPAAEKAAAAFNAVYGSARAQAAAILSGDFKRAIEIQKEFYAELRNIDAGKPTAVQRQLSDEEAGAVQRQIITASRKRSEEQFKLLSEENKRRTELAAASIEREKEVAIARTAGSQNQIEASQQVLAAETSALRQRVELAKSTARTEIEIVDARHQAELQLARQASAADAGFTARRVEIDRRSAQDRAKIAQAYYAELQRLESVALSQFKASKEAQKSIENELLNIRKSADEFAFENKIAGEGPISQSIDREKRALEQIKQLREAAGKQDVERARQLRADIEAQARTIAGLDAVGASDVAQRVLTEANAVFQPLLQKQLEIEQQREANSKKALTDIQTQIKTVEQEINRLQANPLNLQVAVDNAAMQSLVRSIQEQLGRTPFQIAVQPVVGASAGSVPGLAEGGPLGGYSPSPKADNLLFAGTAGEYMQPVAAVRHYGVGFMESIRNLDFPRFADGGLLGGGGGSSGAPGATGDRMELSLTIGGKRIGSVFGPRDTVRGLADALQELSD
jgi:hypothetical protein